MKKAISTALCLISLLLLCSCGTKDQIDMKITRKSKQTDGKTVVIVNEIEEADIWILPRTEENLKTTLWGTATAKSPGNGGSVTAPLCEPGDGGLYIFRMIDSGSFYYSADGIVLSEGCTLRLKEDESGNPYIEITDISGNLTDTVEVFRARL